MWVVLLCYRRYIENMFFGECYRKSSFLNKIDRQDELQENVYEENFMIIKFRIVKIIKKIVRTKNNEKKRNVHNEIVSA